MARRRRSRGKPIELFPFLAILACVIGVLTLMIAGLSMGALKIDTSGTDFVLLGDATAADLAEIGRLERESEGSRIRGSHARHAREELTRREAVSKEAEKLQEQRDELAEHVARAVVKRDALLEDLEALQRRLAKLENELEGYRDEAAAKGRIELKGPKARRGQRKLKPRFVECRKYEIVLDADAEGSKQRVIALRRLDTSVDFRLLYTEVRSTKGAIVILLVREGAVETYDVLSAWLTLADVRYGALPVPSAQTIDFSTLKDSK